MIEDISGKNYTNSAGNIILTVTEDKFAAYLTFTDSPGVIDENEILALLKKAGIKHGFSSAIKYNQLHGIKKELDKPFLIARGTDPNANPEINLLFDRHKCFNPHESYNVMEMTQFEKMSKGQALAEIAAGAASNVGKDVLGNEVSGISQVKPDFWAHIGQDIELDENTNTLVAMKSGYPFIDDFGKIQIKSDFYINENIVGIRMEINGDLVVNGTIENSHLQIDGSLTVYGHVKDCMHHGIIVSGDINVDFAEHSRLISKGQIKIYNTVSDSILSAVDGIWGDENSTVIGGLLQCSNSISLYNVGTEKPVLTEIEISLNTYTKEMLKLTQAKLEDTENLPSDKFDETARLTKLMMELEKKYLTEIDQILDSPEKRHKISILKSVYPETRIRILNHSHTITEEKGKTIFTLLNNDLVVNEVDRFV